MQTINSSNMYLLFTPMHMQRCSLRQMSMSPTDMVQYLLKRSKGSNDLEKQNKNQTNHLIIWDQAAVVLSMYELLPRTQTIYKLDYMKVSFSTLTHMLRTSIPPRTTERKKKGTYQRFVKQLRYGGNYYTSSNPGPQIVWMGTVITET